ncbi:MAG TPA: hypothetical protein VGO80_03970 [Solirubrobacteraceae bacterium]|jgi:hypothetical protein|nr:hypothetical protein [Solirubrobacteraceae bacterium]
MDDVDDYLQRIADVDAHAIAGALARVERAYRTGASSWRCALTRMTSCSPHTTRLGEQGLRPQVCVRQR